MEKRGILEDYVEQLQDDREEVKDQKEELAELKKRQNKLLKAKWNGFNSFSLDRALEAVNRQLENLENELEKIDDQLDNLDDQLDNLEDHFDNEDFDDAVHIGKNITINNSKISGNSIITANNKIVINGQIIPPPPGSNGHLNTSIINGKIYCNGYEYKDGEWKKSAKAFWNSIF